MIPNAAKFIGNTYSDVLRHRVIAVGRMDYQKGFDRLVCAWGIIQQHEQFKDWHLDIFGQGEWKGMLQQMIDERGLGASVALNAPTKSIGREYVRGFPYGDD